MHIEPDQSIGSIVADDYRTAAVFSAHGIDFCCKGGRSVEEACRSKGLDPSLLIREIHDSLARDAGRGADFNAWSLARLVGHIEKVHHRYVEDRIPVLRQFLGKLCRVHGERHPELFEVASEFDACAAAMTVHMKKEELVLFPFILQLEKAAQEGTPPRPSRFGAVEDPVHAMMDDHDAEGERFRRIAGTTGGYAVPPDGCATYSATMAMLKEFEEDLHLHIHLENNILFPRAVALEQQVIPN